MAEPERWIVIPATGAGTGQAPEAGDRFTELAVLNTGQVR